MKKKLPIRKEILFVTLTFLAFIFFVSPQIQGQPTYNFLWNKEVNFGLTSSNTTVSWSNNIYLNQFSFNDGDNITFTGLYLTEAIDALTLGSQTSNLTVTVLTDTSLVYNTTGSGTEAINYYKVPSAVYVDGVRVIVGGGWSQSGNITTITGATDQVRLYYEVSPYVPGGSDSIGFTDPLFQYLLEGDYLYFVIACYTTVMGQAFWGIIVFFLSAVVYLRTKSLFIVGLIYMLLGPTFIMLFWEFSFLAVLFTIIGIASVLAQFLLVWRNRA